MLSLPWVPHVYHAWIELGLAALVALALALALHLVGGAALRRAARGHPYGEPVLAAVRVPAGWLLALVGLSFVLHAAADDLRFVGPVRHLVSLALIGAVTWLLANGLTALGSVVDRRNPIDVADNLHARQIRTQSRVLVRSGVLMIVVVGIGLALITFPGIRQIGASLLASAGVVGLVAGFAARPVIGNLIAGLQIALTQPIRIDDVLIVEGEWGRVEEITGSFVVVRIWDDRRLVVPLQWFIEHPFQNWTRSSADLIGSVIVWLDYQAPMEALRSELERIVRADRDWDGRVCVLQVTDANDRAVQVRALVSAANAGRTFDLRCRVREALIAFVQREHPHALPHVRHVARAGPA